MKKLSLLIFIGVLLALVLIVFHVLNPIFPPTKTTQEIPVNQNRLYADVQFLTAIQPPRNYQNLDSLNRIADYIFQEFQKLNLKPEFQEFTVQGNQYKNVIASFGPKDAERIIIGAHYDVDGNQPGADDNASAVAGLLEIARLVHELKPDLKYRLDFVAYTLEEMPFFRTDSMGSAVHAASLKDAKVKAMICLEMIGYFTDEPHSQKYPLNLLKLFYPGEGNFIAVVGKLGQSTIVRQVKKSMRAATDLPVHSINGPASIPGLDFSDHQNYWKAGYPAVMITDTSFYRNPHYHQTTDTIDTLDFAKMAEVVKGVHKAVMEL